MPETQTARQEIAPLLRLWNDTLLTEDAHKVAALYAKDATLLPTLSKEICQSPEAIAEYFRVFLSFRPKATILHENIRLHGPIGINSGIYSFEVQMEGGVHHLIGRFTFVYRKDADGWKILAHHSSLMPEHEG